MEIGTRWPRLGDWGTRRAELVARTEDGRPIIAEITGNAQISRAYIGSESDLPVDKQ